MTGTPEQITAKKAARIVSTCRAFFPWYEPQIKDKFERQAWEELKAKVIPEVESYTDAAQLIADRQKFADKTLLQNYLLGRVVFVHWIRNTTEIWYRKRNN